MPHPDAHPSAVRDGLPGLCRFTREVFTMPKSPDERIDLLEKRLNQWRLLAVLTVVLLLVTQRNRIVGWIDSMEGWMGNITNRG